ncbi:MAG: hypothetical protein ACXU9W_12225, partial [Thermodesulfobacteriota bacterium]
ADGFSFYRHYLQAIGKLPVRRMNVYIDRHVLVLLFSAFGSRRAERTAMITIWIFLNYKFNESNVQSVTPPDSQT